MARVKENEDGSLIQPAQYGMPEWPDETLVAVTLAEHDGKTTPTFRQAVGPVPSWKRAQAEQAWAQSFDRLAGDVASA